MRAVISVIGKDTVGILAAVSAKCADYNINILDVTQSVLQDMFVMVMMTDISGINTDFASFVDELTALGNEKNLSIRAMHEDIFNAMHNI
ncbi:MAG: ACT domain-containing protein [Clostridia bacterium]|nr:ACT domain-containing protein [Clostridia bacterium]